MRRLEDGAERLLGMATMVRSGHRTDQGGFTMTADLGFARTMRNALDKVLGQAGA